MDAVNQVDADLVRLVSEAICDSYGAPLANAFLFEPQALAAIEVIRNVPKAKLPSPQGHKAWKHLTA